ncbi:hypothetical protein XacyCFBP1159_21855 [Xanthomonas arboricola pv. corylina]|nr:hypothetical protein XacyCFBP1159_21855 [Xanthomonas arboricola pv. corylina]
MLELAIQIIFTLYIAHLRICVSSTSRYFYRHRVPRYDVIFARLTRFNFFLGCFKCEAVLGVIGNTLFILFVMLI